MKSSVGILLIVLGGIILGYGIYASESIASEVSRVFTGTPTDRTMYLIGAGAVSLIAGIFMMLGAPNHPRRTLS